MVAVCFIFSEYFSMLRSKLFVDCVGSLDKKLLSIICKLLSPALCGSFPLRHVPSYFIQFMLLFTSLVFSFALTFITPLRLAKQNKRLFCCFLLFYCQHYKLHSRSKINLFYNKISCALAQELGSQDSWRFLSKVREYSLFFVFKCLEVLF